MTATGGTSPVSVGVLRGLLLAVASAVIGGLAALTPASLGQIAPFMPLVILALRAAEAYLLDRGAGPQTGALGGAPAVNAKPGTGATLMRPQPKL